MSRWSDPMPKTERGWHERKCLSGRKHVDSMRRDREGELWYDDCDMDWVACYVRLLEKSAGRRDKIASEAADGIEKCLRQWREMKDRGTYLPMWDTDRKGRREFVESIDRLIAAAPALAQKWKSAA